MTRDEAIALMAERLNLPADESVVGPAVEAIAARIRRGGSVSDEDLEIALALLLEYVTEVQRTILGACHVQVGETTGGKPKYRLGWFDVGVALGFPGGTAPMRALKMARRVGLVGPARPRSASTDLDDSDDDD